MSRIADIVNGQQKVGVEGKVNRISSPRTVLSKKTGEELKVADVTLSDDMGAIKLVLWKEQIRQVKENTAIRIEEGYVKEFREELQLSVGRWGMIITLL